MISLGSPRSGTPSPTRLPQQHQETSEFTAEFSNTSAKNYAQVAAASRTQTSTNVNLTNSNQIGLVNLNRSSPPRGNQEGGNDKTRSNMAAPAASTSSTSRRETNNNYVPSRKNAIVIENTSEISQDKCLRAVADTIGGKNIHYCTRLSGGRICLYLTDESYVDKLCTEAGIVVDQIFLPCRRYISHATKVVISNCPPELSDEKLKLFLEPYGKVVSAPSRLHVYTNYDDLKHIKTWRRVVYVLIPHDAPLMPKMMPITSPEGAKFNLYLDKDEEFCTYCNVSGHPLEKCKKKLNDDSIFPEFTPSVNHRLFHQSTPNRQEERRKSQEMSTNHQDLMPQFSKGNSSKTSRAAASEETQTEETEATTNQDISTNLNQDLEEQSSSTRDAQERRTEEQQPLTCNLNPQEKVNKPVPDSNNSVSDWHEFEESITENSEGSGLQKKKRVRSPEEIMAQQNKIPKTAGLLENVTDSSDNDSLVSNEPKTNKKSKKKEEESLKIIMQKLTFDPAVLTRNQFSSFLKDARGKANSRTVSQRYHCDELALVTKLQEALLHCSDNFNLTRRLQRAIEALQEIHQRQ